MDLSESKQWAVSPTRGLKVSEAIRIGAKIRPQCYGGMFVGFGSCALGAAMEGFECFGVDADALIMEARVAFAQVIGIDIPTANDQYRWTREEIAEVLERIGL